MRLFIIALASFTMTACSAIPESWKFDTDFFSTTEDVSETVVVDDAAQDDAAQDEVAQFDTGLLAQIEVGQTKEQVLEILGPSVNVDSGVTLADHYVKGGEVYDVLYFRAEVDGVSEIRALLFKADRLVGIGWSDIN